MSAPGPRGARRVMPILFAALVSATVASVAVYLSAADVLKGTTDDKYRALMQVRRDALREYLDRVLAETLFWNKNRVMRNALLEFTAAWKELPEPESTLQRLYIDENPYPTGEKDNLEFASDGSTYSNEDGEVTRDELRDGMRAKRDGSG